MTANSADLPPLTEAERPRFGRGSHPRHPRGDVTTDTLLRRIVLELCEKGELYAALLVARCVFGVTPKEMSEGKGKLPW